MPNSRSRSDGQQTYKAWERDFKNEATCLPKGFRNDRKDKNSTRLFKANQTLQLMEFKITKGKKGKTRNGYFEILCVVAWI